jgi:hypothetical protein
VLVGARTALVNAIRGLTKAYGERLRKCHPEQIRKELAAELSPELRTALEPLFQEVQSLTERIQHYDREIEKIAKQHYLVVAQLQQVNGVGTLIALTYVLTVDDPHRFGRSRDLGCYIGLRPGRRNSGNSQPQLHISKQGNRYLRTLMVQGAHYILGPFGKDSDLRRWGLMLAQRGGRNAKKRALVAVARKLAVLLHKLWVSGEVYEPLRNHREDTRSSVIAAAAKKFDKIHRRVRVTAARSKIGLPGQLGRSRSTLRWQHPLKRERPTGMEPKRLVQQCGWKDGDRGGDLAKEKLRMEPEQPAISSSSRVWHRRHPSRLPFRLATPRPGLAPAAMPEMILIGGNGRY